MRLPAELANKKVWRSVLYLLSIGLAIHLVLPQIPGLERSIRLVTHAAPVLIVAALVAELMSWLSYSELMGRSVGMAARLGRSSRDRKRGGLGRGFMLRLAISENGASHVLPGGGASMAVVTYGALRSRGFPPDKIGVALTVVSTLVYGSLGIIFAGSLAHLLLNRDLDTLGLIATLAGLAVTLGAFAGSYAAYRSPRFTRNLLTRALRAINLALRRGWSKQQIESLSKTSIARFGKDLHAVRRQLFGRSSETFELLLLAFGYWIFDFLCLVLVFQALGVPAGIPDLLVAYGVATAAAALPLTPGGIGIFETTMLATLTLLGVGAVAAIPILGYRLFNFWLPIPLTIALYPTLRLGSRRYAHKPRGSIDPTGKSARKSGRRYRM
ncbi:MAG: YbhN family protein [Rubrobacteraceae bacterium]